MSVRKRGVRIQARCTGIVVAFALLGPAAPGSALAQDDTRFHVLVIGDTDDGNIGRSVAVDVKRLPQVFEANVPPNQLAIVPPITGGRVRETDIARAIRGLAPRVRRGVDVVVFYYAGHGAFDQFGRNDHFCALPTGERLYHADIRNALSGLGPRLAVVLTDVCSTFVESPIPAPAFPAPENVSPLFSSLFLEPSGMVDITAARPGEAAQGGSNGGVFTFSMFQLFTQNSQRRMTWDGVLREVNVLAHQENPKQTAYAVIPLPHADDGGNSAGGRFGALTGRTALGNGDNGVEVLWVAPGSPATRIRDANGQVYELVPGRDVITHVDGAPVTTAAELAAAVRRAGTRMTIRVVDHRVGEAGVYEVKLAAGQTRFGVFAQATARSAALWGIEVTSVMPGSPGYRIRQDGRGPALMLVPHQDVITHINGVNVRDEAAYREAVRRSPDTMWLRVYDSMTGQALDYEVELVP